MWKIIILLSLARVIHSQAQGNVQDSKKISPDLKKLLDAVASRTKFDDVDCSLPKKRLTDVRICHMVFHVENYQAMGAACGNCSQGVMNDCMAPQCVTADGIERGILTVNRQIPGPLIEVYQNDILVIDVLNKMHSESASIHWHGILMTETPYMDGVPFVTQCPIHPANSFRYTFLAEDYGTYFYHSHSGVQRYSGFYGGLSVKAVEDEHAKLYTKDEHVILLSDWSDDSPEMFTVGLPRRSPGLLPQTVLINGRGKQYDPNTNTFTNSPYEILKVTPGERYRFRFINAGSTVCPVRIQIQDHDMTIIATDGSNVKPRKVNTLFMATGERYDIILNANKPNGLYWLHVKVTGLCEFLNLFQSAIIQYTTSNVKKGTIPSAPRTPDGFTRGIAINDPEVQCGTSSTELCIIDLVDTKDIDKTYLNINRQIFLTFAVRQMDTKRFFEMRKYIPFFNIRDEEVYLGTINGLSFISPPYPILSQGSKIDSDMFCNSDRIPKACKDLEICVCHHVFPIKYGEVIEAVLIDETTNTFSVSHPMHFHGLKFIVIAQGRLTGNESLTIDRIKQLDRAKLIKRNLKNPPLKDTVAVQNQGYIIIRIIAVNPGAWLIHCHIEDHMVFGMGAVLLIGGKVNPIPPDFPTCGNFPR